jgi:hypothetical protein
MVALQLAQGEGSFELVCAWRVRRAPCTSTTRSNELSIRTA